MIRCNNKIKDKITLSSKEMQKKSLDTIQHPLMTKTLNKIITEETYLNIIKATDNKPSTNGILNGES